MRLQFETFHFSAPPLRSLLDPFVPDVQIPRCSRMRFHFDEWTLKERRTVVRE